jgi:hypothetical protein
MYTSPPTLKTNTRQCKSLNTSLSEYCEHYIDHDKSGVRRLCAHDVCGQCKIAGEQPVTVKVYSSLGEERLKGQMLVWGERKWGWG